MAYDVRSVSTVTGTGTSFTLPSPAGATVADSVFVAVVHGPNVQVDAPANWQLAADSAFNTNLTVRLIGTTNLATGGPWTFQLTASGAPVTDTYVAAAIAVTSDTAVTGAQRPVVDVARADVTVPSLAPFTFRAVTPANTGDVQLLIAGWGRYTTFDEVASGATQRVERSTGTASTSRTLWVGSIPNATSAGILTFPIVVPNENPGGFAADGQAMLTVTVKSVAPPTSWVGDFETGDFSQYAFYLAADATRIAVQSDTPRQGSRYARFTALDTDVYPLTPTENPRAQLVSPRSLFAGMDRWITWSSRFPSTLPAVRGDGWLVFWQWHGPPFVGSPSVGFGLLEDRINLERNQTYSYDEVWSAPLVRDVWQDFLLHVKFAADESGFIELWFNGVQQKFANGRRRLFMRTLEPDQIGGVELAPTLYRKQGMFDAAALDHDALRYDPAPPAAAAPTLTTLAPVRMFSSAPKSAALLARVAG